MKFSNQTNLEFESLDINITPLIDIVFLLLIFFMVTTTFVDSPLMNVELPKASTSGTNKKENKSLVLNIDKNGEFYIDEQRQSLGDLKEAFSELARKSSTSSVIVRADTNTSHGSVVKAMDLAKQSGIGKIAIATRPE